MALFPLPVSVKKRYISICNMKQTRPHLQVSSLGLVNKYGSKNPKSSQKQGSCRAYGTAVSRVDIQLN